MYFLQLEEVNHNNYATSAKQDSLRYRNTFHAICRKHGLPYIEEYANEGKSEMRAASLLTREYNALIDLHSSFWNTQEPKSRHQYRKEAKQYLDTLESSDKKKVRVASIIHHAPLFTKEIPSCHPVAIAKKVKRKIL